MSKYQYLKFERFVRDCPANEERKAKGKNLTYDVKVLVEGEHRATFHREIFGRGYRLYDPDNRPIPDPTTDYAKHLGQHVASKEEFEPVMREFLAHCRIPTLADLEEKRAQEIAWAAAAEIEARKRMRERRAHAQGAELLAALRNLLIIADGYGHAGLGAVEGARRLIADCDDIGEGDPEFFKDRLESEVHHMRHNEDWQPEKEAA